MVKFTFLALASAIAAASAAAPVKKTVKLGNRQLRRGDKATEALLKKAVPYKGKKAQRKLDEEQEIVNAYSYLQFSECVDVKVYDEDLLGDEDLAAYAQSGAIVPTKSYVLFHVATADTIGYDSEDDVYMVDLATYLTNVATYHANIRSDYCEQCEQFEDYCNPEEEEEEEAEQEEQEQEGEEDQEGEEEQEGEGEEEGEEGEQEGEDGEGEDRRKLKKSKRKLTKRGNKKYSKKAINRLLANNKEFIDCNQCSAYECYVDEENMDDAVMRQDELDEGVSQFIEELAQCQETGVQMNGVDLYMGAMCSPYGDGVELAVFANEDCTWYTSQKSVSSVYNPNANGDGDNDYNINYLTYAENYIKKAFQGYIPCEQKEYADPDEEDNGDNNDEEDNYEASEYCRGATEEASHYGSCYSEQDNQEEEEEDENAANYNWFTYDVKEAEDTEEVCVALQSMDRGELSHTYDDSEEASGSWYERNKKGKIITGDEESSGLSAGAITAIVLISMAVLGAVGFFMKKDSKKKSLAESDYQGGEMS